MKALDIIEIAKQVAFELNKVNGMDDVVNVIKLLYINYEEQEVIIAELKKQLEQKVTQ